MKKLRIAIYHHLHSGGAKRVTAEHLFRLAARHEVTLFSLSSADHTFANMERYTQIPTYIEEYRPLPMARSPFGRINPLVGMLNIARLDRLARRTAQAIDSQAFDLVLAHPCQVTQAPLLLRWLQTPSLYYCHELPRWLYEQPVERPYDRLNSKRQLIDRIDPLPRLIRSTLRRLDRQSACAASQIVVNSRLTQADVAAAYHRDAEVCSPAVAAEIFRPITAEREPFVLSVGALTRLKGFEFILRAIGTLPVAERPPFVILSNYQEPNELQYLTNLAAKLDVKLECRTGVMDAELSTWYARAGCVAYAPIREPFGLVALEAMAAGAPVIGVADGGIMETIEDQKTGLLVPREPQIFGQAIRTLLVKPARAAQLGQTARQVILSRWTWQQHIEQLEPLLNRTAYVSLAAAPQAT
jgi:glycosyltransferase involved in cell wall biosynthesis